jgi:putative transposase
VRTVPALEEFFGSKAGLSYHFTVRLGSDRVCTLVIVGFRADGKRELVALAGGHRESTASWADLLSEGKRRGMRAPVLAIVDGALGFWAALREVFPDTRDWVHKAESTQMRPRGIR